MKDWKVKKIGVIGPGIVGMPMAGMLAHAELRVGQDEAASVMVVQRNSENSGWKVGAINAGKSVIGGIEPGLDQMVASAVEEGRLAASHDFADLADADLILVAVQTDKAGLEPDYGPLMGAMDSLCTALQKKPEGKQPVIVFESTLAPSSMTTVIREKFASYGLEEGRDVFLGNSPNRVMPGRLVERVESSDKLVAGLHPDTPGKIRSVYSQIVTKGSLLECNSMSAEIVKTLENAYRDVRIAFTAEIQRYCDDHDLDFYRLREEVNLKLDQSDAASFGADVVPSGGMLIPTLGVGGHCLPKDGILLWWRGIEQGVDHGNSLILESRNINNASPSWVMEHAARHLGSLEGKKVSIMGTAYRFNSEDTRNSPSLELARLLLPKADRLLLHDPFVKEDDQNLKKYGLTGYFTRDLGQALEGSEILIMATAHQPYMEDLEDMLLAGADLEGIYDAANLYPASRFSDVDVAYAGMGRGNELPAEDFIAFVCNSFKAMEKGVANELIRLIGFLNRHYGSDGFNEVEFKEVQHLAASCSTGCLIANPGPVAELPQFGDFSTRLAKLAFSFDKGS